AAPSPLSPYTTLFRSHPNPGHERRAGVLGFLREPSVELGAHRGEARGPALPEFRRIEGNPEGRVLGQEHHVLPDHVALDGTVLRSEEHTSELQSPDHL